MAWWDCVLASPRWPPPRSLPSLPWSPRPGRSPVTVSWVKIRWRSSGAELVRSPPGLSACPAVALTGLAGCKSGSEGPALHGDALGASPPRSESRSSRRATRSYARLNPSPSSSLAFPFLRNTSDSTSHAWRSPARLPFSPRETRLPPSPAVALGIMGNSAESGAGGRLALIGPRGVS